MRYVDEVQEMDDWLKHALLFSLKVICVMFVNILDLFSYWSVQVLAVVGFFFFDNYGRICGYYNFSNEFVMLEMLRTIFCITFFPTPVCICYVCAVTQMVDNVAQRNCLGIINIIMGHGHDTICIR
jgi:hypothetical protein